MKRRKLAIGLALLTACYLIAVHGRSRNAQNRTNQIHSSRRKHFQPGRDDGFKRSEVSVCVITRHVRVKRKECTRFSLKEKPRARTVSRCRPKMAIRPD